MNSTCSSRCPRCASPALCAVQDTDKIEAFEDALRSGLLDEFERLKRQNREASARLCKEQIDKLYLLAKEEMAHVSTIKLCPRAFVCSVFCLLSSVFCAAPSLLLR